MIPLSVGIPNPDTFPFKEITVDIKGGKPIVLEGEACCFHTSYYSVMFCLSPKKGAKLKRSIQYVPAGGIPELRSCLLDLQQHVHNPPRWEEREILPIHGGLDAVCKITEMVMEEGKVQKQILYV